MAASPDVLVIGGGVIGLSGALELAAAGLSVEVCDKGDLGREASWAGAGIIPPGNSDKATTPFEKLRAISSDLFFQLPQPVKLEIGYLKNAGIEFLSHDEQEITRLWEQEGIRFQKIDKQLFAERWPMLGHPDAVPYFLPDMAQVRNPRLLQYLVRSCVSRGVKLRPYYSVETLETSEHRIVTATTQNGEKIEAGHYLIAAGAWAERFFSHLGCPLDIHPVRGQIILLSGISGSPAETLIHGKQYFVPRGDGVVLVGSTEEPDAGFENSTTPHGIATLKAFAERLMPSLRNTPIERAWSGLRPGSRDGLPFIGFVPGFDNALAAVGHFRSGIQLSLGTARLIADLILKRPPLLDPALFRLDRPVQPPTKLAFRS